jgi:hypothetical protein
MNGVSVKLNKSKRYMIQAAVYYDYFETGQGFVSKKGDVTTTYTEPTNAFVYVTDGMKFSGITTWVLLEEDGIAGYIPCDTFYGTTTESFDPSSGAACSVNLERISAGLMVTVEGLTEGYITITNQTRKTYTITKENNSMDGFVCSEDLVRYKAGWVTIKAIYHSPTGETVSLVDELLAFTRGMRKRLHISISKQDNSETNSSFAINWTRGSMTEEDVKDYNCVI